MKLEGWSREDEIKYYEFVLEAGDLTPLEEKEVRERLAFLEATDQN